MKVNVQYAETHLSDLASAVDNGEEVEITRPDKPALRLVVSNPAHELEEAQWQYPEIPRSEIFGCLRGKIQLADDWDSPETNAEIAALFEGEEEPPEIIKK